MGVSQGVGGCESQTSNNPINLPRCTCALWIPDERPHTSGARLVDASTSVYTHAISSTAISFDIPSDLPAGYYHLWVMSNAVPSDFKIVGVNLPPAAPAAPAGPSAGYAGYSYSFTASAVDPAGAQVRYGWDWDGNGTVDEWSALGASGWTDTRTHSYGSPGAYNIKVKAENDAGGSSGWSAVKAFTASAVPPSPGTWRAGGAMSTPRRLHTATVLPSGKVLISGGYNGGTLSTAELYDPVAGSFAATGSMSTPREHQTATLLPNGKVLISGGLNGGAGHSTAELYDPSSGSFATTGSMSTPRDWHTATLLPNGKVLISGGIAAAGISPRLSSMTLQLAHLPQRQHVHAAGCSHGDSSSKREGPHLGRF